MNTESIIERKELRDQCVGRIEVLQKVKALMLIPHLECMTIKQVAEYYEVDRDIINKCYQRNQKEVDNDGVVLRTPKQFTELSGHGVQLVRGKNKAVLDLGNGVTIEIPNRGTKCFSKRAVMRIGMLLRDSRVAQELRTQLLNVVENTEVERPELLTSEIDYETQLQVAVGRAAMSGDPTQIIKAMTDIVAYKNRHIDELEKANEQAEEDNRTLAGETLRITSRKELVRSVRCLATRIKKTIPATWNVLYKQLLYKFSISLANRKAADSRGAKRKLVEYIRPDEWRKVQMTISAILKDNHISPTEFYDEVFDDYYMKRNEE